MTINGVFGSYAAYGTAASSKSESSDFDFLISGEEEPQKTDREIEAQKSAEEIKRFFAKMDTYGNALTYVVKSNLEKIKELVEKRKEELKKAAGFYSEPPLSPEAKADAMKAIDDAIKEYTKELMKELEEKSKAEKELKQKSVSLKDILAS